eukprot:scpid32504/ scgid21197/ 
MTCSMQANAEKSRWSLEPLESVCPAVQYYSKSFLPGLPKGLQHNLLSELHCMICCKHSSKATSAGEWRCTPCQVWRTGGNVNPNATGLGARSRTQTRRTRIHGHAAAYPVFDLEPVQFDMMY